MNNEEREYYRTKATEERDKRDFVAWLESQPEIKNVRPRDRNIDFRIGDQDVWPDYTHDDHLNAISSSSLATWQSGVQKRHDGLFVTEVKVHLPPAREALRDEIDSSLELPDGIAVHYGTGALGGMPAPDGVVTPHILQTGDVTFRVARTAVEEALGAYEEVYDGGENAIKEQP